MVRPVENRTINKSAIWLLVIVGFVQGLFYAWNTVMTSDQEQLLAKGIKLAFLGQWEHYGNLVTSGGNVPGSLTTLLVGLPLMVVDSPMAPSVLVGLLQLVGLGLLILALRERFTSWQVVVFCGLFWLSPWRVSKAILWNPSYLLLATGLHLFTFHRLQAKPKSFWISFWHVLAIGYAFELHPSALLLALMSGFLWLRKTIRVNWYAVGLALLLILVSLIPWFLDLQDNRELAPVADVRMGNFHYGFNLVNPFSFIKGVAYWPRYTSLVFPHYIFSNLDYSRFGGFQPVVRHGFDSLRWLFGGVSILLGLWAFGWLLRRFCRQRFRCADPLDHYILAGLVAMVALVALSPAELSHWHLYLLLPVAVIAFCRFLFDKEHWWSGRRARVIFCALMLYFVLYNAMACFIAPNYYSPRHNMRADYPAFKASLGPR
jgi:hypothetical protein